MKNRKWILGIVALAVVAALLVGAYLLWMPKGTQGTKALQVQVVHQDGTGKELALKTDQEFLRGALEEVSLISGEESAYGLFVKTVDGYTADDGKQEWWLFTKGGEELFTGVDATPVADGDHFEITLKTGY